MTYELLTQLESRFEEHRRQIEADMWAACGVPPEYVASSTTTGQTAQQSVPEQAGCSVERSGCPWCGRDHVLEFDAIELHLVDGVWQ